MIGRSAAGVVAVATGTYGNAQALHAPVLVLNASYEPINVCAARRAIVLVLKGVAMAEEENGHFLHAARVAMRVPSVIRLLEYRRIPHQTRHCRARTSCCAIEIPASTAESCWLRANSHSITWSHAHAGVPLLGRTWSPAAIRATGARAINCPRKPA